VSAASNSGTPLERALRDALPGTDVETEIVFSDRAERPHESLVYIADEATS
jgi:hypothetical protein